jgi:hypothetical protein
MHDLCTRGPWRVLILDPSGDDPKWVIATVTAPAVTEWVRGQVGSHVRLVPITGIVWRIDREATAE